MMSQLSTGLLNTFHVIKERNLTIVFDTSGSMYQLLDVVKTSIVKLVHYLSHVSANSQFNVISFSKSNNSFSESVVPCTKENLSSLTAWLQTLECETQTDTLLALVSAFSDDTNDGVVVFTDGLPNQKSSVVLKCIKELSQDRPLHAIYINSGFNDENVIRFWEKLAAETNGTVHIMSHVKKNCVEQSKMYPRESYKYNESEISDQSSIFSDCSSIVDYEKFNFKTSYLKADLKSRKKIKNELSNKLIGKNVLAKRKSDGYYYKATIVQELSLHDVLVVFNQTKEIKFQLQQECDMKELIFYDEAKLEKIYEGDHVLVDIGNKNRFVPGKVLKKDYDYDHSNNNFEFTKVLKVNIFDEKNVVVSMECAVQISYDFYNKLVQEILQKQIEKVNDDIEKIDETKRNIVDFNLDETKKKSPRKIAERIRFENEPKGDYLREKIEKQLAESVEFLQNLGLNEGPFTKPLVLRAHENSTYYNTHHHHHHTDYDSGFTDDNWNDYKQQRMSHSLNIPNKPLLESVSEDSSFLLTSSYPHIKAPRPPPKSWQSFDDKTTNKRKNRHYRSASVGSNVVERSKKHWAGRPISKEITPKRPINERYQSVASKTHPPKAEEYQTSDGVPFPVRTDNKLYQRESGNWFPGKKSVEPYKHHDIISHRVVDLSGKPNNDKKDIKDTKKEKIREKNRFNALQKSRAIREQREQQKKRVWAEQVEQRDEQTRKQKKEKEEEGYTKIQITIEKDRSILENKQRQYDAWRRFEAQREHQNQQRKFNRIDAMKERKTNYPQLKEDNGKQMIKTNQHKSREEKHSAFEQTRLDKQIGDHEAKLLRLKKLRKSTDARFDALRRSNDNHRDITGHVKGLDQGRVRAEILP